MRRSLTSRAASSSNSNAPVSAKLNQARFLPTKRIRAFSVGGHALAASILGSTCQGRKAYAPFSHFAMELFLAAPDNGLPSALTAFAAQLSARHFFMNDVLAAPASALPSLPTALLSQVSCAIAVPAANVAIIAAKNMALIMFLSFAAQVAFAAKYLSRNVSPSGWS
jgi:hypothetical protein